MKMNPLAMFLAIGGISTLFLSPCRAQQTNTPAVTATNAVPPVNYIPHGWKFGDPGELGLSSSHLAPIETVTKTFTDGSTYVGEAMNGKPDGQGTLTSRQGTNQQGEWRDGLEYMITGTWVSPDGTKEVGTWNRDGSKSGGTITWKDGRQYVGDWKLSPGAPEVPDGYGKMRWPDGHRYEGNFRDGKLNGTGKMIYRGDKVEDGLWKDDKFVGTTHEAAGTGTK